MRRHPRLDRLLEQLKGRLDRLALLASSTTYPATSESDRLCAYICLELANTWQGFIREFYLSCTVSGARSISGLPISPAAGRFADEAAALLAAIRCVDAQRYRKLVNQRRRPRPFDEPTWFRDSTSLQVFRGVGLSNVATLQQAFAVATDVFDTLPRLRNFYAHRSERTARTVRAVAGRYGLPRGTRASDVVAFVPHGKSAKIVDDWIASLRIIGIRMST
jgi:hypothetical protein